MVVTVRGETGFVFRVVDNQNDPSKRAYAICYADRTWEAHYESTATPWNSASTIPDELPSGAVTRKVGRHVFPEGFLYGGQQSSSHEWVWYSEYRVGGAGDPRCYTKSRLGALKAGQGP